MMHDHSDDLSIGFIQADLHWKSPEANCAMLEEMISASSIKIDLWVLPEMFNTGFTMDVEDASEPMNFFTTRWMKLMAQKNDCVITGSFIVKENQQFYNRLLWVTPAGVVGCYDKRHLFRMAGEDKVFKMGGERQIFTLKGWNILPQICYDLRFPVWSRNRKKGEELEYDLAVYVANWPIPRTSAWDILLKARAVENLCYVIGVNRVGHDGNNIEYAGHSAAYDFKGENLRDASSEEGCFFITLNKNDLKEFRKKFPAWMDADQFELIN